MKLTVHAHAAETTLSPDGEIILSAGVTLAADDAALEQLARVVGEALQARREAGSVPPKDPLIRTFAASAAYNSRKRDLAALLGYTRNGEVIWERWTEHAHGGYRIRSAGGYGLCCLFVGYNGIPGARYVPGLNEYWDDHDGALRHTYQHYLNQRG